MANLLCIETSGEICSVSLFSDAGCLDFQQESESFQHAAVLTVLIDGLLKSNNLSPSDLDAIAVSAGPGSYTGLRIGTSVAKGMCYALDIPLLAISSLKIIANGLRNTHRIGSENIICPLIDARRMEVYTATYDGELNELASPKPLILDQSSFASDLEKGLVHFVGSGSEKSKTMLIHENARFFNDHMLSAKYIGDLAFLEWEKNRFVDVAYFEPFYLKEFYTTQTTKK